MPATHVTKNVLNAWSAAGYIVPGDDHRVGIRRRDVRIVSKLSNVNISSARINITPIGGNHLLVGDRKRIRSVLADEAVKAHIAVVVDKKRVIPIAVEIDFKRKIDPM